MAGCFSSIVREDVKYKKGFKEEYDYVDNVLTKSSSYKSIRYPDKQRNI